MHDYVAEATAAGLLGLDPVGAVVAVAALSLGASRRALLALTVGYLVTISALGTGVALAARAGAGAVRWHPHGPDPHTLSVTELAVGAALAIAGLALWRRQRRRRGAPPDRADHRAPVASGGLVMAGAGVAASLLPDPGFIAMVVASVPHHPVLYPAAFAYWGLWSQCLMVAICAAAAVDRDGRLIGPLRRAVDQLRAHGAAITAFLLVAAGAGLVVDGLHRLGATHLVR